MMVKNQCRENGNDIYSCHPVHTVEFRFVEPLRETRIGLKNQVVTIKQYVDGHRN